MTPEMDLGQNSPFCYPVLVGKQKFKHSIQKITSFNEGIDVNKPSLFHSHYLIQFNVSSHPHVKGRSTSTVVVGIVGGIVADIVVWANLL